MEMPNIQDLAEQLQTVSGAKNVDVDASLMQMSDVDSLDLMEWLYGFQEKYPHIPASESLFKDMDEGTTLRTVYDRITALVPQA
jgi:acyl carrier protein